MKTINSSKYRYVGVKDNWHVFESILDNFDPEMLLVYRARYIMPDGSSRFFDPIKESPVILPIEFTINVDTPEMDGHQHCMAMI